MSATGEFWNNVKKQSKSTNPNPVMVGEIVGLKPLKVEYQGVVISSIYGDTIFINNLLLDDNIELDLLSMDSAQNFSNSTAYQLPSFIAEVSGTQRLMLRMLIDEIQYEYTNKELTVKLKPVFEALRLIKLYGNHENESEKVRTLKKPLNREVLEYLCTMTH